MTTDDDFDYWTQVPTASAEPSEPLLNVETIEGVEPLDDQFGVMHPKTVPDALYPALFGQPAPTEDALRAAGGDPDKVPPLHTYAILDAAKVMNLPEMLETSGLEHRCLFKGDAYDALKDVAPWIVRLEEGNTFTRNLFTRSDAPWHLWDKEPGIYLRSHGTLDNMWKHFRKFTKVQDEQGNILYFRFWEPKVMARYGLEHAANAEKHFGALVSDHHFIALDLYRDNAILVRGTQSAVPAYPWPMLRDDFAKIRLALFCEGWSDRIVEIVSPLGEVPRTDRLTLISDLVSSARHVGFRLQKSVERYTLATILIGQEPEALKQFKHIIRSPQHELDRSRKLLKLAKSMEWKI